MEAGALEVRAKANRNNVARWIGRNKAFAGAMAVIAVFVVAAAFPDALAPYSPNKMYPSYALNPPSGQFLLGTDEFGRDVLSRIILGSQWAMIVALTSIAVAAVVALPLGLVAGYYGGAVDTVLMRIQDAILAFPTILFAILIVASFGASALTLISTIALLYVPRFARLVRSSVLVLKNLDFVTASRASGARDARIIFRAILPNCLAPILVQITMGISVAILIEAILSYLGLGIQPPTPTWGNMLQHAQSYLKQAPWYVLAPGFCIFVVVLTLNFIGDRLRDTLDPRLKQ